MPRVLHICVGFAHWEGMGRSIVEMSARVPDVTAGILSDRLRTVPAGFSRAVGGSQMFFHVTRRNDIETAINDFQPDLLHLHGGILTTLLTSAPAYRKPTVLSVYSWPRAPFSKVLDRRRWRELTTSQVGHPRVFLTSAVPDKSIRYALQHSAVRGILTPDPMVARRLGAFAPVPVELAQGAASVSESRARYDATAPTIVFAGRAETARGVDTLIDAMPQVIDSVAGGRLRLLLLPSRQLGELERQVAANTARDAIEIVASPQPDLSSELADATIAAFPFKYDHTTITPPLAPAEAMSVGLPVIGTDVDCMAPLLHDGINGLSVVPGAPDALADAIVTALEPNTWEKLSAGALETIAEEWSWEGAADTTAAMYERALA